jgi:hypothetical protein
MLSVNLSWAKASIRIGDHEFGVEVPKVIGEAFDDFNPGTYTDHGEEKEVTLPVKTGQ